MLTDNEVSDSPLTELEYFVEWGGGAWRSLVRYAIQQFVGTNLSHQYVLDLGTRFGKMACFFARMGGKVIGTDVVSRGLRTAQGEAKTCQVADRVLFVTCSGDLDLFKDDSFDLIFTKSVLIVVKDLEKVLVEIKRILKPNGKIVFIENARGLWPLHVMRSWWHIKWDYTKARYFTEREIDMVRRLYGPIIVKRYHFPPIILMLGRKRELVAGK